MSRHTKIIKTLARIAYSNPAFAGAKCAAAIYQGGELISVGFNHRKSHPLMRRFGRNKNAIYLHAEIDAIRKALNLLDVKKLSGSILYIARVTKNGEISLSKPCNGCQKAIVAFDIKEVLYTTDESLISNGEEIGDFR